MEQIDQKVLAGNLIRCFFPELSDAPFSDEKEQRQAWIRFLELLCLVAQQSSPTGSIGSLRLSVDPEEVLMPVSPGEYFCRDDFYNLFCRLRSKGFGKEAKSLFSFGRVIEHGLCELEILAAVMAMSISVNRKFERIFGLLQEEKDDIYAPTVGLCVDLARFFLPPEKRQAKRLLDSDTFFNRCLVRPEEETWFSRLSRPLVLEPYILSCLLGRGKTKLRLEQTPAGSSRSVFAEGEKLGGLAICARRLLPPEGGFTVHPEPEQELCGVIARGGGRVVEIAGECGSGRRYLLRSAAAKAGRFVLAVDMTAFAEAGASQQESMLREMVARGVFDRDIICLWNLTREQEAGGLPAQMLSVLLKELPVVALVVEKPLAGTWLAAWKGAYRLTVPEASTEAQKALWQEAAEAAGLRWEEGLSLDELVSKYVMNPGRIRLTIDNVLAAGGNRQDILIDRTTLEEQIRRICAADFGENATRLSSPFTREDLIIDAEGTRLLNLAIERVRFRSMVNGEFGFGKKLPYGRGTAIVFYGPPGTGKTMAAQVMARELGLDIYRIDLSQVSSKYIGETEKNLGAVFEAAKNSNAILFFDEADALFSKRTEVSSSNDKYANAETSYLLQKIEEYPGVSVLATNNMQNFDAAFKRRMTYLIPVAAPDEPTRRGLWEAAFPAEAPLDDEVDTRLLAQAVELTGAQIKSIALAGAYRAAAGNKSITYEDLIAAIDDECTKVGRMGEGEKLRQAIMTGYEEPYTPEFR